MAPAPVARADKHIWGIFIALCIISVIELYSASSREVSSSVFGVVKPVLRHMALLGVGVAIVWGISRQHYSRLLWPLVLFTLLSAALMVYVLVCGDIVNGARRSFSFLGIGIFPAEMVKLSVVVLIVLSMARNQLPKGGGVSRTGMVISSVVVLVFSALLVPQGLTNTLLLVGISYSMMIVAGAKLRQLAVMTGIYVVFGLMGLGLMHLVSSQKADGEIPADAAQLEQVDANHDGSGRSGTWWARIQRRYFSPVPPYELEMGPKTQQEIYSYMAQANGGVIGVFPGNSREASRLPLAFSDYIYAIIVEEMGLVGGLVVLALYLWLLGRAAGIASRCNQTVPALLVIGMAVVIVFQALFHMAIVTGCFPVSGQPLPLISKGGTSIIVTAIAFGVMLSVSRTATRSNMKIKSQQLRDEADALPQELRERNPMQL